MSADHSPAVDPCILDAQALSRLRELDPTGSKQLLARVASAFLSSTDRLMPELQVAMSAICDLAAIRHIAHTLKSSSASVGALTLSRRCAEIERLALEGRAECLPALLDAIETDMKQVRSALNLILTEPRSQ